VEEPSRSKAWSGPGGRSASPLGRSAWAGPWLGSTFMCGPLVHSRCIFYWSPLRLSLGVFWSLLEFILFTFSWIVPENIYSPKLVEFISPRPYTTVYFSFWSFFMYCWCIEIRVSEHQQGPTRQDQSIGCVNIGVQFHLLVMWQAIQGEFKFVLAEFELMDEVDKDSFSWCHRKAPQMIVNFFRFRLLLEVTRPQGHYSLRGGGGELGNLKT
jgi:hypothetical protein